MSEQKNFRNAMVVKTTAKKQSNSKSTTECRRVSDNGVSVMFGGGAIFSRSALPDTNRAVVAKSSSVISRTYGVLLMRCIKHMGPTKADRGTSFACSGSAF